MYCPKCLNSTLKLTNKGIIFVIINGKKLDNGRFMYDLSNQDQKYMEESIEKKLDEFLKWYSHFNNIEPIAKVDLISGNFVCTEGCKLNLDQQFDVIDIVISRKKLDKLIHKIADNYGLNVTYT